MVTADIRNLADEEVMQLVGDGSPRAFELLYDRHGGAAFSLAYRMVGDRVMAEDISQEAFLSIWRSRMRYDASRGSVRTWVLGIVHNRTIDALRRGKVHERRREQFEGVEERHEVHELLVGQPGYVRRSDHGHAPADDASWPTVRAAAARGSVPAEASAHVA